MNILEDLATFKSAYKQREEAEKIDNIPFEKLIHPTPTYHICGGEKVEIYMTNGDGDDFIDYGYLFALPFNAIDEYDVFIHVTHTSKDEEFDDEWLNLQYLLTLPRVIKIKIITN